MRHIFTLLERWCWPSREGKHSSIHVEFSNLHFLRKNLRNTTLLNLVAHLILKGTSTDWLEVIDFVHSNISKNTVFLTLKGKNIRVWRKNKKSGFTLLCAMYTVIIVLLLFLNEFSGLWTHLQKHNLSDIHGI